MAGGQGGRVCNVRVGGCVTPCGRRSGWEGVQHHVAGGQGGRVCNTMWQEVRVGGCVTPCGRRSGWEGV